MRYEVIEGSQSAHCCFGFTVVDMERPTLIRGEHYYNRHGEPQYEAVCECFTKEDAEDIAAALNYTTS